MRYQIAFRALPFIPDYRQVIYVENQYDEGINTFIRKYSSRIEDIFKDIHFEFVYIPMLGANGRVEERVKYYAPYLKSEITYDLLPQSSLILNSMANPENRDKIEPSLLVYGFDEGDDAIFRGWTIDKEDILGSFETIADDIFRMNSNGTLNTEDSGIRYRCDDDEPEEKDENIPLHSYGVRNDNEGEADGTIGNVRFSLGSDEPSGIPAEMASDEIPLYSKKRKGLLRRMRILLKKEDQNACYSSISESARLTDNDDEPEYEEAERIEDIIDDLEFTVKRLQLKGISLAAIHEMIDKQETISRMVITREYRIFLPDYNNIEIEMTDLPKALFFLFLRYPEGIVLKELQDHYTELFNIYRQLRPCGDEQKMRVTITKLVNPIGNAINENIARIRAPFIKKFDEHLAKNYFISGRRGERYSIPLDRNLIDWEE